MTAMSALGLDRDPIVVTGMGCLAAGVADPDDVYRRALAGRSPAEWVDIAHPGAAPRLVAAVRAPDPDTSDPLFRPVRRLDRAAQLGLAAARHAWTDAALGSADYDAARIGVIVGTGRGPIARTLDVIREFVDGPVSPSSSADSTPGSLSGVISQSLGALGPGATVVATCASAATAIGVGAMHLALGDADVIVAGGVEAPIVAIMVAQLEAAGVLGHHDDPELTCRPFDVERNGLVAGEGAGFLVLERASSARRRGAFVHARLAGWASGTDAGGRTGMTRGGEGLVTVARRALARADMRPEDIGYVNAHGTGTRLNDATESRAFATLFGGSTPAVSSTKPVTGHCLGATPAIEAIISIRAMSDGCLPPTANLRTRDPECALDVIAGGPRPSAVDAVLSTSMGFWGMLGALVFTRA